MIIFHIDVVLRNYNQPVRLMHPQQKQNLINGFQLKCRKYYMDMILISYRFEKIVQENISEHSRPFR